MIQNLIFGIILLKILFLAYNFFIFIHMFQRTSSKFFFDFRFSRRKSQSQQKLLIKITYFAIQVRSKHLTHFANLNSLDIENNMPPKTLPKTFLTLQIFQEACLCLVSEKTFALQHFLTPKNCILEALWKQMFVYFCISN